MGINAVYAIAKNTYREIIRDRILYGLLVFAILLIGLSLALGQLSFAEQSRITINFGFTAIHISAAILSIFVGSTLVGREIEKKTILTLLAKPISRSQFLIGKCFGLLGVIVAAIGLLSVVLAGLLLMMDLSISGAFLVGLYGILIEAAILLVITIFFGCFTSPMLAVSFSIGIFLIGHWLDSLTFFAEKSESTSFKIFAKSVTTVFPNFEMFNWRSLLVYGDAVPHKAVLFSSFYGLSWCIFMMTIASFILRKRDLG